MRLVQPRLGIYQQVVGHFAHIVRVHLQLQVALDALLVTPAWYISRQSACHLGQCHSEAPAVPCSTDCSMFLCNLVSFT